MKIFLKTPVYLLFIFSLLLSKTESTSSNIHDTWRSKDDSKYRVWFQNWSEYTRLFLTINEDTITVEPNKYAAVNKKKPYLFPKPYKKVYKRQLIGNIEWNEKDVSWRDGYVNTFKYIVDRSNPKLKLPVVFEGLSVIENGVLRLELISGPDLKYNMELIPTHVE